MKLKAFIVSTITVGLLSACTQRGATDSAVIFSDDFNIADGNLSTTTWAVTASGGSFSVKNQMAYPNGSIPEAYYNAKVSNAVGSSTKIKVLGGTASAEFYLAMLKDSFLYSVATESYMCGLQGGTLQILDDVSIVKTGTNHSLTDGSEWTLTMTVSNGVITCSISGNTSETITHTDSTNVFTEGYFGIIYNQFGGGNYTYFDDFTIF